VPCALLSIRVYPVEIRRLEDSDVESVTAVLGLARLYQGNGYYLVAWRGKEPVGHAYLAPTDPPELQDVSVLLAYRRRGVATDLTRAAEQDARGLGFERVRLTVSADNEPAQALYRRCGYHDVGAPPRRVQGTIQIRTGPIQVDDILLTWEKKLEDTA
jgi:RimJ/RimL family protein N-acetyltransferase